MNGALPSVVEQGSPTAPARSAFLALAEPRRVAIAKTLDVDHQFL